METSDLTIDSAFWTEREANTALLNPVLPGVAQLRGNLEAAAAEANLSGHVVFSTSGTTGTPKFACLSRYALLASARAVNAHLEATAEDRWFCALPTFHVGGVGIWARAHLVGSSVSVMEDGWAPAAFCEQISKSGATLTSVVPTQVHDLVVKQCRCPSSLRAVLVGGGAVLPDLRDRAIALGWPLLETFGMTEAASQIATQSLGTTDLHPPGLRVLPIWTVRSREAGELEIRGDALFSGYLKRNSAGCGYTFAQPFSPEGWFRTSDRVGLVAGPKSVMLSPLCRTDDIVKILGENVDISAVEAAVRRYAAGAGAVVAAIPDRRAGSQLIVVIEQDEENLEDLQNSLRQYNDLAPAPERLWRLAIVPNIPTTELGKVAKDQLISLLSTLNNFRILK